MSRLLETTPRADGYRMPGEFEPHAGCWLLFPQRSDVWRNGAKPAQHAYAQVAAAIARFEPVTVGVGRDQFEHARTLLPNPIRVVEMSYDDAWMRDVGPAFVSNDAGDVRGVDWQFNAWGGLEGGLYFPWDQDDLVPQKVLNVERVDRYRAPLVAEGGALTVDGEGTLITTTPCLLNTNRNPDKTQDEVNALLSDYLSVEKIIWLDIATDELDETDGHVDGYCCFVRPGVVLLNWCDDPTQPDYDVCRQMHGQLSAATDARGRKFEIHKLHQANPHPVTAEEADGIDVITGSLLRREGEPVTGTYINFYIANGGIVMPLFDDPQDEPAMQTLRQCFPDREVVGVPCREIILGGGNIHCITQQQPRGRI